MKYILSLFLLIGILFGQATSLENQTIGHPDSTFKQLLRFENNAASQITLKQIFDGTGDSTALWLSHDSVKVGGNLTATTLVISDSAFIDTLKFNILYGGIIKTGTWNGSSIADAYIDDDITITESDPHFLADVRDSSQIVIDWNLGQNKTILGNWVNTTNKWEANELVSTVIHESELAALETDQVWVSDSTDYLMKNMFDDSLAAGWIVEAQITDLVHFINSDETDQIYIADPAFSITSQHLTDLGNLSGTNTGDQTLFTTGDETDQVWISDSTDYRLKSTPLAGEVSGAYGSLVIGNDVLDDQYFDSEGDLTTLLDDNYVLVTADRDSHTVHLSFEVTGNTETGIAVTAPGDGTLDFVVDHDAANNYVAQEHIRWDLTGTGTVHINNYIENVPTALSIGTTTTTTVAITSDSGADDVIIPAAINGTAGLLTDAKWDEIVINNAKVTTQWTTTGSDIYYTTGNVGIGIASPTSKLHVYSTDNPSGVFMVDIDNHDAAGTDARGLKVRGGANNSVIPIFVIADYSDVPKFSVMGDGKVGIRTESPSSPFHIKASTPGVVGDSYAGQLIIQSPTNDVNTRVVITGYKSNDSGNPDEQLWYIGSASGGNENVTFLNQRNAPLSLGTSGTVRFSISGAGAVDVVNDFTAGTIASDGVVKGATYGSDASISDAELLTIDDGATTEVLVGGGAGSAPVWGSNIPTAVTIGNKYIYRAHGTYVPVTDGGTGKGYWTEYAIPYASAITTIGEITPAANSVLVTDGSNIPSLATDIPTAVTIGTAYIYRAGGTDVPDGDVANNITASNYVLLTAVGDSVKEYIDDTAYNATSWDSNLEAATKNAIRDKIEGLPGGHDPVTLNASATTGGLSLSTQEINYRAATNAQTGYMTAALVTNIEANVSLLNVTPGTATASKALVVDSNKDITLDGGNLTATNLTGTLQTAAQTNITSVGALGGGSIASGFGAIDIGADNLTATGTVSLGGTSFNDNNLTDIGTIVVSSSDNYVMEGYATGRNVGRTIQLAITPGDNPGTNISIDYVANDGESWNNPSITDGANITKGATVGSFALSEDGTGITMDLTEVMIGLGFYGFVGGIHLNNSSTTDFYSLYCSIIDGDLAIYVDKIGDTGVDWTTILQTGDTVNLQITFYTSS